MMSKIEWTEETWNPTTGCNKISQGCKNCYAEKMHKRLQGIGLPKYKQDFNKGGVMHEDLLEYPLKFKKPTMFFVNSMSDLFHEDVSFEFIEQVFLVMARARRHTFQVLTKRIERAVRFFNWFDKRIIKLGYSAELISPEFPLPNVWIGTSCEDQATANDRIPYLRQIPAAVRFLSCEPLLGPIDFSKVHIPGDQDEVLSVTDLLDWVITGGESGPGARPCHPDWIRSLRDQCKAAEVPFFFKQWGEWSPYFNTYDKWAWVRREDGKRFPDCSFEGHYQSMGKIGKKKSGHLLDGVEHREFPKIATRNTQPETI